MPTVIRDKQINFKVNSEYFELAKVVFQENGLDITSAFNEFVQEVAISKTLPFKTVEEKEREKLIARLQEEVSTSYEALKADKGLSVEEARKAVLGQWRNIESLFRQSLLSKSKVLGIMLLM